MKVLKGFLKKELIALLRSPVLMVAILIMPIVQMILLSGAISLQATNLRLVMQYLPNDVVMEKIYKKKTIGINSIYGLFFIYPSSVGYTDTFPLRGRL